MFVSVVTKSRTYLNSELLQSMTPIQKLVAFRFNVNVSGQPFFLKKIKRVFFVILKLYILVVIITRSPLGIFTRSHKSNMSHSGYCHRLQNFWIFLARNLNIEPISAFLLLPQIWYSASRDWPDSGTSFLFAQQGDSHISIT